MKEIMFRPLRLHKKSGKIIVASYMQWRKVKTADYDKFKLIIDDEFRKFNPDELVYNHKGEHLFWYNHNNPESLPKNHVNIEAISKGLDIPIEHLEGEGWKVSEPIGEGFHWSVRGFDCDGIPCFSHYNHDRVAQHEDINVFEPLTVKMVVKWYGWIIYNLKNNSLQIGNSPLLI